MNKQEYIKHILSGKEAKGAEGKVSAYAPSNIALCKYWGKRDAELNLPTTSSLSISLADRGVTTVLQLIERAEDQIIVDENSIPLDSTFATRLMAFLDLFRPKGYAFRVETNTNIPIAAGLASSAAGFAALVQALNLLFDWQLSTKELSLLARLGSGSAARSLWHGFVQWHRGERSDGLDSYAEPLSSKWPALCVGLIIVSKEKKDVSSREAMRLSKDTSRFYSLWPEQVAADFPLLKQAIINHDFQLLGKTAEANAMAMHATMLTAMPCVMYWLPETVAMIQRVYELRHAGVPVYFTEDAGPNIKLLFEEKEARAVHQAFPTMELIKPFMSDI